MRSDAGRRVWSATAPGTYGGAVLLADRFRPTPRQYLRITHLALAGLALIIVTGASVRLTGSGLGCTDWPLCEEGKPIAPLEFHAMIEFINRLITGLVSVAVGLAVLGSMRRRPRRRDLTMWSWFLVAGVVAQIIIGAFVTLSDLKYSVVALHFLVSMVLVWAAVVLMNRAADTNADTAADSGRASAGSAFRSGRRWTNEAKVLVGLGTAVLVSGSVATSSSKHPGAIPDGNGVEHVVERLPLDLGSVVRAHSVLVWLLCLATVVTAVRLRGRSGPASAAATQLLAAIVAQGALGYVQYFSGVPALMVGFHVAGSILVWVLALRFAFVSAIDPVSVPAPRRTADAATTSVP